MPVSLPFEPFVPARFGVTGQKTVIIGVHPHINALCPPMFALTRRSCGPFHLCVLMDDLQAILDDLR